MDGVILVQDKQKSHLEAHEPTVWKCKPFHFPKGLISHLVIQVVFTNLEIPKDFSLSGRLLHKEGAQQTLVHLLVSSQPPAGFYPGARATRDFTS